MTGIAAVLLFASHQEKSGNCKSKQVPIEETALEDYKERIKTLVTIDQVFDAYSSVERNGERFLTRGGLLQALLSRSYMRMDKMDIKEKCAHYDHPLIGTGHSHLVSKTEFKVLVALLAVPLSHIRVAFKALDIDNSGTMDKGEFAKLMERLIPGSGKSFESGNLQETHLMKKWFGEDGKRSVHLEEFEDFLTRLADDVCAAELKLYSTKTEDDFPGKDSSSEVGYLARLFGVGNKKKEKQKLVEETLSMKDLALTLISAVPPRRITLALEALEQVEKPSVQVPLSEALLLHRVLSVHCDDVTDAIGMYSQAYGGRVVDFSMFERAVKVACQAAEPPSIPPRTDLLALTFKLWDKSRDGLLNPAEISEGLREKRGHKLGIEQPPPGIKRFSACLKEPKHYY